MNYRWLVIFCILSNIIYHIFLHPNIWENRKREDTAIAWSYEMKLEYNSDISDNHSCIWSMMAIIVILFMMFSVYTHHCLFWKCLVKPGGLHKYKISLQNTVLYSVILWVKPRGGGIYIYIYISRKNVYIYVYNLEYIKIIWHAYSKTCFKAPPSETLTHYMWCRVQEFE